MLIRVSEKPEKAKLTTKIATLSVGIDGINHALRALYAYKGAASYKDLAKGANLHPVYMSQSLSSARDVGLVESAGKRGLYKLTSEGEEYARFLSYGQRSESREVLRKAILNNPLWSEILRFLRMSEGQARAPLLLVADIEGKLGKRWSPSLRTYYATTYASVLESAGLVRLEGGNMVSLLKLEARPEEKPTADTASLPAKLRLEGAMPVAPEGYAEFSIPDSFRVMVRKDLEAFEFFKNQVKEGSIFSLWIEHEKNKLGKGGSGEQN